MQFIIAWNTESKVKKIKKTKTPEKLYSLKELKAFLPDDTQGLNDILQFSCLEHLKLYLIRTSRYEKNNRIEINELAQKWNPMFKQIKAVHISTILDWKTKTLLVEFHALVYFKDKIKVLLHFKQGTY
jgi:hypothetical protein